MGPKKSGRMYVYPRDLRKGDLLREHHDYVVTYARFTKRPIVTVDGRRWNGSYEVNTAQAFSLECVEKETILIFRPNARAPSAIAEGEPRP